MQHVMKLAVVTSCGASWWLSKLIGEPGRKTILRGIRALCAPTCSTRYLALYNMDTATRDARERHIAKVRKVLGRW
jgi:putative NADPH-quinone reductase